MVGLPSVENREKILRTLLSKEKVEEGLDYKELAVMTEGYSGSDLKVCIFINIIRNYSNHLMFNFGQLLNADLVHDSSISTC